MLDIHAVGRHQYLSYDVRTTLIGGNSAVHSATFNVAVMQQNSSSS